MSQHVAPHCPKRKCRYLLHPKTEAPPQSSLIQHPTAQASTKTDSVRARGLRRPVSMQVRSQPPAHHATPPQTAFKTTFDFENMTPPPAKSLPSPPRPTRNPPPPPPFRAATAAHYSQELATNRSGAASSVCASEP